MPRPWKRTVSVIECNYFALWHSSKTPATRSAWLRRTGPRHGYLRKTWLKATFHVIESSDIQCQNMSLTVKYPTWHALVASHHSSSQTVFRSFRSPCGKNRAKSVLQRKAESSSHPDIDHQLPIFGIKCYVLMPWIQSMCHAEQPVPSSLPEIFMFWPSTTEPSGPGGWHFGALTKSKKIYLQNTPRVTVCSYDFRKFHLNTPR